MIEIWHMILNFDAHLPQLVAMHANMVYFILFGVVFLQIGEPDHWLDTPAASPAAQMGHIMIALEKVASVQKPDLMMVVGDVNSTLAGALVANKMDIRLAHLESGLRSGDLGMPEEINRILTDRITHDYFVTEMSGMENLAREGASMENIHFAGNTMIDTLVGFEEKIQASSALDELGLGAAKHVLMTIHRPATVDHPEELSKLVDLIASVAKDHPALRTRVPEHPPPIANQKSAPLETFPLHRHPRRQH